MKLKIGEIGGCLGARVEPNRRDDGIDTLLTDSRSLMEGDRTLFFALRTEGNDGHRYVQELYDRGVRHFVVSEPVPELPGAVVLRVSDTLAALQRVGEMATESFQGKMVAITGSRGKTILKEWLFQLMEPLTDMVRSPRSFNSQIGVPLSLWEITPQARMAVIEVGISRKGEMGPLARIIKPDTVIFTNLHSDHAEGFSSSGEKIREKALLMNAPSVKEVIFSADSPEVSGQVALLRPEVRRFGWSLQSSAKGNPDVKLTGKAFPDSQGLCKISYLYEGKEGEVTIPYREPYDIENGMHALAFMLLQGYDMEVVRERFGHLHEIATRLNVVEGVNSCTLMYDSYTSDYASLLPAIDFMRRRKGEDATSTVILSDVRHEPTSSSDTYRELAHRLRQAGVDRFIGVGPKLLAHAGEFGGEALFFVSTEELLSKMSPSDFVGDTVLIKGAPEFGFQRVLEHLEARKHETVLEVNLDAIVKNFNYFRKHLPPTTGLIAMVKASGYGAGSYEIAKTMQEHGAAYLAVAVLDEGLDLRRRGITMPIMVMNPKVVNYKSMFAGRLEPEIYSLEMLADVIREGEKNGEKEYPIHIKLDTGMHRMGFVEEELPEVARMVKGTGAVKIKSLFSHLATADCPEMDDYTELQLARFRRYTDYLQGEFDYPILRHVLNSAGILRYGREHHYDLARLGIGLYGANTLPPEMEEPLAPVSALRTVVISVREWKAGETIGYGRKGVLKRDSRIATIPIGYADGMNRHFGNGNIRVLLNGHEVPTIGNICMDACMLDVTGVECSTGDVVEIFGPSMPVQRLADVLDTIPYEILTAVSPRVKRVYFRE